MLRCVRPDPTHLRVGETSYRVLTISVLKSIASEYFLVRLEKFRKRTFLGIKHLTHANFSKLDKIFENSKLNEEKIEKNICLKNFKIE